MRRPTTEGIRMPQRRGYRLQPEQKRRLMEEIRSAGPRVSLTRLAEQHGVHTSLVAYYRDRIFDGKRIVFGATNYVKPTEGVKEIQVPWLTGEEYAKLVRYVRTHCPIRKWGDETPTVTDIAAVA